jgi:hypothetical protein
MILAPSYRYRKLLLYIGDHRSKVRGLVGFIATCLTLNVRFVIPIFGKLDPRVLPSKRHQAAPKKTFNPSLIERLCVLKTTSF